MLEEITNLGKQRTKLEAFIYYILLFVILVILAGLFTFFYFRLLGGDLSLSEARDSGTAMAIIISLALSFYLLKIKNLMDDGILIFFAALSGGLALLGGGFLGLIIPCYFLTLANNNN